MKLIKEKDAPLTIGEQRENLKKDTSYQNMLIKQEITKIHILRKSF